VRRLFLYVLKILNEQDLAEVNRLINSLDFRDGKKTALGLAKEVKSNLEADPSRDKYKLAIKFLNQKFRNNIQIKNLFLPHSFSTPIINKYTVGDACGKHFDSSHMQTARGTLKSDFSFTLMLSPLEDYDGGELFIESDLVNREFKIGAGDAVIYSSNDMHQVNPVTRGQRIAYIGWMNSSFRDYSSFDAMKEFEKMHAQLLKYDLSDAEKLKIAFVKNKLKYALSK